MNAATTSAGRLPRITLRAPLAVLPKARAELKRLAADVGQTFFAADARVGYLMFAGLCAMSPRAALFAAAGTIASDAVGRRLRPNKKVLLAGALGLNGFFAGLAASALFAGPGALVALVIGSLLAALLSVLAPRVLGQWQLPSLALPYVGAMWLVWTARFAAPTLTAAPYVPPPPFVAAGALEQLFVAVRGTGAGMAQIFFQTDWRFGLVMLGLLALLQRRMAAWATLGSFVGSALALALGAMHAEVAAGYYGFSPALATLGYVTMVAPAAPGRGWRDDIIPAMATQGLALILTLGLAAPLAVLGLPGLALPYILAIWLACLAKPVVDARGWAPGSWE
jgi:urea transporter